jgi:foldase protein PrsA
LVQRAYRRKALYAFYSYLTRDAVVPEEELRAFYDANAKSYNMPAGYSISKIVVNTKEAADSVIMRVRGGEAFEDIARVRSRDPFTAPAGGDAGLLTVGQDLEFDGFIATMEVSDIKAFRSLEGYVVLWLRDRRAARPATYDEAVESIRRILVEKYQNALLGKWVADRRIERGVKVNTQALEALVMPT